MRGALTYIAVIAALVALVVSVALLFSQPSQVSILNGEAYNSYGAPAWLGKPDNVANIGKPFSYGKHGPDSDHKVPEFYGCYPNVRFAWTHWVHYSSGKTVTWIQYDTCGMNALSPGPKDWQTIRGHERYHARGWDHYEGPASVNKAYYPSYQICHC